VPYALRLAGPAERTLGTLPEKAATALLEFILGPLLENPHRVGKLLTAEPWTGLRAARVGPYRVIYAVDENEGVIEVVRVGPRADAYRA
jgi:mRNA interferase RelE/StbE